MDESDDDLIRTYLNGDESAFARLAERHLKTAYNFALRFAGPEDADDIVQESFVKAWRGIKSFSRARASFKTWFMRIVRNSSIDHLRKRKMLPFSSFSDGDEEPFATLASDEALPPELSARMDDAREVERALRELPPEYREVLILRYQQDMAFEAIAEVVGAPLNTVKSRHRRALHRLRSIVRI